MKKYILFFSLSIFLCSCGPSYKEEKIMNLQPEIYDGRQLRAYTEDLTYFRDVRTNKCFAQTGDEHGSTLACVPCDSAVLAIIAQQKDIENIKSHMKLKHISSYMQ